MAVKRPAAGGWAGAIARRSAVTAWLLAAVTVMLFSRTLANGFIDLDDNVYVTRNPWVGKGLAFESLATAFSPRTLVSSNWHPLTMTSHLIDVQLWGLRPWGHHLTSVLVHAASTGLVYLLLWRATGQFGPSLLAAALFGWHPLRVESVAWVAERKDVLCTFFGLWAAVAYVDWTRLGGAARYAKVALLLVLGLLCKSMLVTLPAAFVLLDYWPLGRLAVGQRSGTAGWAAAVWPRIREKLPLAAIAAIFSVFTVLAQYDRGIRSLESVSLSLRLGNAVVSYTQYVGQFVWPAGLAPFYPHPGAGLRWPLVIVAAAALALVTASVIREAGRRGYLFTGWFWFLGTLFPVIGLVQTGGHARADRFMYLPSLGLALIVAWGLAEWVGESARRARLAVAVSTVVLAALAAATWVQLGYWHDTERLFRRTVAVTGPNYLARHLLANALVDRQAHAEALEHIDAALAIRPDSDQAAYTKAAALHQLGRLDEAAQWYARAFDLGMQGYGARFNYAMVLVDLERLDEAQRQLALAEPEMGQSPQLRVGRGLLFRKRGLKFMTQGRPREALECFRQALAEAPELHEAAERAAWILATDPDPQVRNGSEALRLAQQAVRATQHGHAEFLATLAAAHAELGQYEEARAWLESAGRLAAARAAGPARQRLERQLARQRSAYENQRPAYDDPRPPSDR